MKSQFKVKTLILLAVIILIALFSFVGFQLVKISQAKKQIENQQQLINSLQQQIDAHQKNPDSNHDLITGEE